VKTENASFQLRMSQSARRIQFIMECMKSELDIFKERTIQTSIISTHTGICFLDCIQRPYFLKTTAFQEMVLPSSSGVTYSVGSGRSGLSVVHHHHHQNPILKRCGFGKVRAMDKVQKTDPSNTVPSSKTFRDEYPHCKLQADCSR
jgi:hypothetical protein